MPTIYSKIEYFEMIEVFYESGRSRFKTTRLCVQTFLERIQPSKHTLSNVEKI